MRRPDFPRTTELIEKSRKSGVKSTYYCFPLKLANGELPQGKRSAWERSTTAQSRSLAIIVISHFSTENDHVLNRNQSRIHHVGTKSRTQQVEAFLQHRHGQYHAARLTSSFFKSKHPHFNKKTIEKPSIFD